MRRSKEQKINKKVGAWKDLQKIISSYSKGEGANQILIDDLQKIAQGYEKAVFGDLVEE